MKGGPRRETSHEPCNSGLGDILCAGMAQGEGIMSEVMTVLVLISVPLAAACLFAFVRRPVAARPDRASHKPRDVGARGDANVPGQATPGAAPHPSVGGSA